MTPAARERRGVRVPLLAASAAAWALLAAIPSGWSLPALCAAAGWRLPSADEIILAFAVAPPGMLAATWLLMLAAMMGPTLVGPLCHVRARSLASRRGRAVAVFLAGYAAAWSLAGLGLAAAVLALLPGGSVAASALVALTAVVWQASPAKQSCLNRCHARPPLAAFGPAAARDAWRFGFGHGIWCVGSCWPLMLAMLLLPIGHLAAMAVLAGWLLAERLAPPVPPGWRWRPWRARPILRLAAARVTAVRARIGIGATLRGGRPAGGRAT
ncbi:hypothetical protein VQ03_20480 [Methylobacterium tarhaniae]|uniref:Metal-binding integral membrane protein n=1 Tax=Methylobacterium tarhaniae TaxID=1187852 RepID=A0A0J6VC60_9HYPH|nr:DUF2182 domain-containing protein [Methylobacterium tarhaniae]KMO36631.1 hypothetical protein VQ03_20480 [Methylobacterium tarhaniae]